jgi:hypothetical protein
VRVPEALAVSRYGNVDGKATIVLSGRPYPGVTEQLQFERDSGLLLRRIITTSTPPLTPAVRRVAWPTKL